MNKTWILALSSLIHPWIVHPYINSAFPMRQKLRLKCLHCVQSFTKPLVCTSLFLPGLVSVSSGTAQTQFSWQFPFGPVSVSCRELLLSTVPLWYVRSCSDFLFIFLPPLADLDHFRVHTRSAVSVREGQGVVLLCGTPTSSGGDLSGLHRLHKF